MAATPDVAEAPIRLVDLLQATHESMRDIETIQAHMQGVSARLDQLESSMTVTDEALNAFLRQARSEPDQDRTRRNDSEHDEDTSHLSGMYS